MLEEELAKYEEVKDELLGVDRGKFVLIKGSNVVSTFESQVDAIVKGYEEFGNSPFLVKRIEEVETPIRFTSNILAV